MKRTALVTGATGPLGQKIATALAQAGYHVICNYRHNQKAGESLARALNGRVIQADVTLPSDVKKLFRAAGRVDVLINAVGDFIYKPIERTTPTEFAAVIENNLTSAFNCMHAALPAMRRRRYGRIINFGSAGCDQLTARPMTTPYYIAKTGLLMLTRTLARAEYKNNITINMISPGVLPHGVRPAGAPVVPYSNISNGILFLLSPVAAKLTGTYLEISRGWRPA